MVGVMSDYICEKCGNECELLETWIPSKYFSDICLDVSSCCGAYYYEKDDKKEDEL